MSPLAEQENQFPNLSPFVLPIYFIVFCKLSSMWSPLSWPKSHSYWTSSLNHSSSGFYNAPLKINPILISPKTHQNFSIFLAFIALFLDRSLPCSPRLLVNTLTSILIFFLESIIKNRFLWWTWRQILFRALVMEDMQCSVC